MTRKSGGGMREAREKEERSATTKIMTQVMHEHMKKTDTQETSLEPDDIIKIVEEMQKDPCDVCSKAAKYSKKYTAFMEKCPALFQKACKPNMDMNMLRFMVETMKGADEEENSSIVGARLAEKFVTPKKDA